MAGNLTAMIASIFSGGVTPDPYYEYTTLLLPGNGTNGAQNNTFLDSSTNNFTITRNGNTTQGTFSPFSQTGWGNYFDGTGDYLSSSTGGSLGSGDFTIEFWVYATSWTTFGSCFENSATQYQVGFNGTNQIGLYAGSYIVNSPTNTASLNQWLHVAICRSGSASNNVSLWINGQNRVQGTSNTNFSNDGFRAGLSFDNFGIVGYLSNLRIVKGTAIYSGTTFTPPTSPLTAISGTSLLTCQSNRFIDNSTNNFTITRNGDTRVVAFSPFNPTASWSAATYGGSGYFDGNGDSVNAASNAAFAIGTGDFTIEAWIYPISFGTYAYVFGVPVTGGLVFSKEATNFVIRAFNVGDQLQYATLPALNTWTHVAASRSGTTLRMFYNGVQVASTTNSYNFAQGAAYIGNENTNAAPWNGYISNFRLVKGTAVYTGNFTPPTAPLTAITNTSLLLNFTNAGIYDATSKNDLETVGNAQISTTQFQFAPSSMAFDGNGDYLIMPDAQTGQFLTGDFTVEYWCRFGSQGTNYAPQVGTLTSASPSGTWRFGTFTNNGGVYLAYHNGSSYVDVQFGSTAYNDNTWRHFALTRSGTTVRAFVNGTQVGTNQTVSQNFNSSNKVSVGAELLNPTYFNGYIQDLRITKGYARYTANFTPPTAAFPTL